jgi:hypothetical protein
MLNNPTASVAAAAKKNQIKNQPLPLKIKVHFPYRFEERVRPRACSIVREGSDAIYTQNFKVQGKEGSPRAVCASPDRLKEQMMQCTICVQSKVRWIQTIRCGVKGILEQASRCGPDSLENTYIDFSW